MKNTKRKELFPNDKRVTVIRADLTTYREWASTNLVKIQGWSVSDVRIAQTIDAERKNIN